MKIPVLILSLCFMSCVTESKKEAPIKLHLTWFPKITCKENTFITYSQADLEIYSDLKKKVKVLYGDDSIADTTIDESINFSHIRISISAFKYPFPNIRIISGMDTSVIYSQDSLNLSNPNSFGYFGQNLYFEFTDPIKSDTNIRYNFSSDSISNSKRFKCGDDIPDLQDTIRNVRKFSRISVFGNLALSGVKLSFYKYDTITVYHEINVPTRVLDLVPAFHFAAGGLFGYISTSLDSIHLIEQEIGNRKIYYWLEK